MKNKKVIIISVIIAIPIVALPIIYFLLQQSLVGASCNGSLPPDAHMNCERYMFGISINNPALVCTSGSLNPAPGSYGICQYK